MASAAFRRLRLERQHITVGACRDAEMYFMYTTRNSSRPRPPRTASGTPRPAPHRVVAGLVAELRVVLGDRDPAELQERQPLLAHQLDLAPSPKPCRGRAPSPDGARLFVVRPAEPAVGREDQGSGSFPPVADWSKGWLASSPSVAESCITSSNSAPSLYGLPPSPPAAAGKLAGRNHLHRLGDATMLPDRLDALLDLACLRHREPTVGAPPPSMKSRAALRHPHKHQSCRPTTSPRPVTPNKDRPCPQVLN